jgi:hypothetical protein
MAEVKHIEINRDEAALMIWALKYVAQEQGHTHLRRMSDDPTIDESGFSERAESLLGVAHRLEKDFNIGPLDL